MLVSKIYIDLACLQLNQRKQSRYRYIQLNKNKEKLIRDHQAWEEMVFMALPIHQSKLKYLLKIKIDHHNTQEVTSLEYHLNISKVLRKGNHLHN